MLSLADTSDLFDQTTTLLTGGPDLLTPQAGIDLIGQWLPTFEEGENTRPLADQLIELKTLLAATHIDELAVRTTVGSLAEQLTFFSTQMGGEGEMPSHLIGLATAFRQAVAIDKTDAVE